MDDRSVGLAGDLVGVHADLRVGRDGLEITAMPPTDRYAMVVLPLDPAQVVVDWDWTAPISVSGGD